MDLIESRLRALEALLEAEETGSPDRALARLGSDDSPAVVLQRLQLMLDSGRHSEVPNLVGGLEPDEEWAEEAVKALVLAGDLEGAKRILDWSQGQAMLVQLRCAIAFGQGTLHRLTMDPPLPVASIAPRLTEAWTRLGPHVERFKDLASGPTQLQVSAIAVAYGIARTIGKAAYFQELVPFLARRRPLPEELFFMALDGHIEIDRKVVEIAQTDEDASPLTRALSFLAQARLFDEPEEAFDKAIELIGEWPGRSDELIRVLKELDSDIDPGRRRQLRDIATTQSSGDAQERAKAKAKDLIDQSKPADALRVLKSCESAEDDPEFLQIRAFAYMGCGDKLAAASDLESAARLVPDGSLLFKAAQLRYEERQPREASKLLEKAFQLNSNDQDIARALFHVLVEDSKFEEAQEILDHFRAIGESGEWILINSAVLAGILGADLEAGLTLYDEAAPAADAVLGKAQLLRALGRDEEAFDWLSSFSQPLNDYPDYWRIFLPVAFATGHDEEGGVALQRLVEIQEEGLVEEPILRSVPIEGLCEELHRQQDARRSITRALLSGRIPWTQADEQMGQGLRLGWTLRTQDLSYVEDDPTLRAEFSVYSTNHQLLRESGGVRELAEISVPPAGTAVLLDASALVTLEELGILDLAAEFFGRIYFPAEYLSYFVNSAGNLGPVQADRDRAIKEVNKLLASPNSRIEIREQARKKPDKPVPVGALLTFLRKRGFIGEADFDRLADVYGVGEEPGPRVSEPLLVDLESLVMMSKSGILEEFVASTRTVITNRDANIAFATAGFIDVRRSARRWFLKVQKTLIKDRRFEAVQLRDRAKQTGSMPVLMQALLVAEQRKLPIMADDRFIQGSAALLGGVPAFGTDAFLQECAEEQRLSHAEVARRYLQLTRFRYRFIVPPAFVFEHFAYQHRNHPPGIELKRLAEYVHDCTSDPGLLGGFEPTTPPVSTAVRFFDHWVAEVASFLVACHDDPNFDRESLERLTEWSVSCLLPSPPLALPLRAQEILARETARSFVSHCLISAMSRSEPERDLGKAVEAMAAKVQISGDQYTRLIAEVINAVLK